MQLFCSQDLQKKLGCKCEKQAIAADPLGSWYAHLITVRRQNILVLVLLQYRFVVFVPGVKAPQWDHLDELIRQSVRDALQAYQIPQTVLDQYLPEGTAFEKCSVPDAGTRGRMASLIRQIGEIIGFHESLESLQKKLNDSQQWGTRNADYGVPSRVVKRVLLQRFGVPIPAMELEFSLDLERYVVRRTLIVPADTTFQTLSRNLQTAFRWTKHHLYEFTLPPAPHRDTVCRIQQNLDDPSALDGGPDEKLYLAREVRLEDLLREGDIFEYLYDFGDNWEVHGKVNRVLPNYGEEMPVCTLWEGASPLEDVGGVPGFLEFLDIISDKKHPQYQEMMKWGGYRWRDPWGIDEINHVYHIQSPEE